MEQLKKRLPDDCIVDQAWPYTEAAKADVVETKTVRGGRNNK